MTDIEKTLSIPVSDNISTDIRNILSLPEILRIVQKMVVNSPNFNESIGKYVAATYVGKGHYGRVSLWWTPTYRVFAEQHHALCVAATNVHQAQTKAYETCQMITPIRP